MLLHFGVEKTIVCHANTNYIKYSSDIFHKSKRPSARGLQTFCNTQMPDVVKNFSIVSYFNFIWHLLVWIVTSLSGDMQHPTLLLGAYPHHIQTNIMLYSGNINLIWLFLWWCLPKSQILWEVSEQHFCMICKLLLFVPCQNFKYFLELTWVLLDPLFCNRFFSWLLKQASFS